MNDLHKKNFMRRFNETARNENRYKVFNDFVNMAAIAIENVFLKSEKLEQDYLHITRQYQKDDVLRISHLLSDVMMGLEIQPCDFLGQIYTPNH